MPLTSIIIPTRNRTTLVQQAIESVLASRNEMLTPEIIVVDDGSTDETARKLKDYDLIYLRGPGKGASAARNAGISRATGRYITFLDDDDTWPSHNLRHQIQLLEENQQFGAICSQVVLTDSDGNITSQPYPKTPLTSGWLFEEFLNYIPQVGSLLVRSEVVQEIGGFDPTLMGGEDWDWALRLALHCQIAFVPEIALLWRMHTMSRFDGVGNRLIEKITWRRYNDVMKVAHRYLRRSQQRGWQRRLRIILKQKGHYIPVFLEHAQKYWQDGRYGQALNCYWYAIRISPIHIGSHTTKHVLGKIRSRNH